MTSSPRLALLALITLLPPFLVILGAGTDAGLIGAPASDVVLDTWYERHMTADELAAGRLPVWNPHTMCGFPQIASMRTGALYPVAMLIAAVAPRDHIWWWTVVVHGALLGLFAYLWLERGLGRDPVAAFGGAAVVALSSFFFLRVFAGQIGIVSALPWLCAVLWRLERVLRAPSVPAAAALAVCAAVLVTAGSPLLILHALIIAALRVVWEVGAQRRHALRPIALAFAGLVFGALLAAPQLLPALELSSLVHRAHGTPLSTHFRFAGENLLTLAAPGALGDGVTAATAYWGRWTVWESSAFLGVTALVLALAGAFLAPRRCLPWLGLGVLALMMARGAGADATRFAFAPDRHWLLAVLAVAAAVAAVIERIASGDAAAARTAGVCLAAAAVVAAAGRAFGSSLLADWWPSVHTSVSAPLERVTPLPGGEEFRAHTLEAFARALGSTALFCTAAAVTLLVTARRSAAARTGAAILAIVVACELIGGGYRYLVDQSDPGAPQDWDAGLETHLRRGGPLARVASSGDVRDVGRCEVAGLDHVGGYDSSMLGRYAELMNAIDGAPTEAPRLAAGHDWSHIENPSAVVRLLGVRHRIAAGPLEASAVPAKQFPRMTVYDVAGTLPRAFVAADVEVIAGREQRLARLLADDFDPSRSVIAERAPPARHELEGPTTIATRRLDDDRTYEMTVEGPGGGYLVFTESTYPGWTCTIDGEVAEIFVADHAFQAVALPPGARTVTFRFTSRTMMGGVFLAAVSMLLLAGWLLLSSRRSTTEPDA